MARKPPLGPTPPDHLALATRRWWAGVVADFALEPHHLRLLTLAGEAWDRGQQARAVIEQHGLTYQDRFNQPRCRPEVSIERDARTSFARMLRELQLDIEAPDSRLPPRGGA